MYVRMLYVSRAPTPCALRPGCCSVEKEKAAVMTMNVCRIGSEHAAAVQATLHAIQGGDMKIYHALARTPRQLPRARQRQPTYMYR